MACKTCNSVNNKCGCKDTPLTTMPTYTCPPNTVCPDPTPCYETIQDTCVKHSLKYSIIDFGSLLADGVVYPELLAGATLEQAYQAMSIQALDTNCTPIINLHPSYVGTTTIIISWENTGADTYTMAWGLTKSCSLPSITGLTETSYTFSNLNPATDYYFKVATVCGLYTSISSIIKVTTL